jgi:quercetin dioxygenase-like cupin family protein
MSGTIPAAQALRLVDLITPTDRGVASRTLAKTSGGNVTLFAFDAGEGLSEHRAPFDALVLVVVGAMTVTVGGEAVLAETGTIVRLPADVPHAIDAAVPARMVLVMLRDPKG